MKRLLGLRSGLAAAVIVLASISTPASADSLDQITVQAQRETLRKQVVSTPDVNLSFLAAKNCALMRKPPSVCLDLPFSRLS
jgi:hypothetical protein